MGQTRTLSFTIFCKESKKGAVLEKKMQFCNLSREKMEGVEILLMYLAKESRVSLKLPESN